MGITVDFPKGRRVITSERMGALKGTVTSSTNNGVFVTLDNGGRTLFPTTVANSAPTVARDLAPLCRACEDRPCSFDTEPPDSGYFATCDSMECRRARNRKAVEERAKVLETTIAAANFTPRAARASTTRYHGNVSNATGIYMIWDSEEGKHLDDRFWYLQELAARLEELNGTPEEDK